ncbi:hypothetical protein BC831DRAFT_474734 [Entophlyctis helioformis]|nr:hypothetical protein BC831DRAFT_474734 [Entophlyctis helioformis]
MYLTDKHICFYASLHKSSREVKAGFLKRRSGRKFYGTYWFVLKNDVLSAYANSTDLYYPLSTLDLKAVTDISTTETDKTSFIVRSNRKKYTFEADTETLRNEWLSVLRGSVFRTRNMGDDVRVVFPLSAVADLSVAQSVGVLTDALRVKVLVDQRLSITEDYYFAYFNDVAKAYSTISGVWKEVGGGAREGGRGRGHALPEKAAGSRVSMYDTTAQTGLPPQPNETRPSPLSPRASHAGHANSKSPVPPLALGLSASSAAAASPLQMAQGASAPSSASVSTANASTAGVGGGSATASEQDVAATSPSAVFKSPFSIGSAAAAAAARLQRHSSSSLFGPHRRAQTDLALASHDDATGSRSSMGGTNTSGSAGDISLNSRDNVGGTASAPVPSGGLQYHGAPQSPQQTAVLAHTVSDNNLDSEGVGRSSTSLHPGMPSGGLTIKRESSEGRRGWWGHRKTSSDGGAVGSTGDMTAGSGLLSGGSTLSMSQTSHQIKLEAFRRAFPVLETEALHGSFSCYLDRVLPRLGRLYISDHYLCFKSRVVGVRATVIVPLSDVVGVDSSRRYKSIYYALVVTTQTQEEIKFDFHTSDARNKCYDTLNELIKVNSMVAASTAGGSAMSDSSESNVAMAASVSVAGSASGSANGAHPRHSEMLERMLPHDVHTKSDFSLDEIAYIPPILDPNHPIKLPKPLHITCLTIGTRGDVQPYVALCKGFMADGHTCRIATHLEYQSWIEGFGIEFREVKGDPAELMQLCVDHGMFTVSFLREAMGKFRGWVDELLESCWTSVQGTDLLIESPTAMGGIHVAEKLGIPYFAAFPMPWTRTRAYPHPFAVPEYHLGGSYNLMSHVLIEQVFQKGVAPQVNRWRRTMLDRPAMNLSLLSEHKMPFLYSFSPSVVPPPSDWQDWIHTCGYWFLDNPEHNWVPPQSLLDFMAAGPKPVYIGFGSIVVPDPDLLTRTIVDAVKKAGVRAILSKGWSARLAEGAAATAAPGEKESKPIEYPDCIYPLDKVPHDWLFPQMAGVVHHGGAGTTAAGIRAGVTTLIRPFFGDQYFWADRVQELGVGLSLRKLAVDKLAAALVTLTTDVKMRERAALLGEKVRAENGVANAVQYVYRDLEFAKTRIRELADRNSRSGVLASYLSL